MRYLPGTPLSDGDVSQHLRHSFINSLKLLLFFVRLTLRVVVKALKKIGTLFD